MFIPRFLYDSSLRKNWEIFGAKNTKYYYHSTLELHGIIQFYQNSMQILESKVLFVGCFCWE